MNGERFLDRYEVVAEVGQGGMAVVYRGVDRTLDRPVAIKVLHPHLAQKAEARARFRREARIVARLRHPNIVEVYDYSGEDSDRAFIIQEYVSGQTLAQFLDRFGPLPPEVAALVVEVVARALSHAHAQGVIHRDIKPENLMVRHDGILKLMDFGIAHVVDMEHLTMTGVVIGSPAHMSPEQVDGKALDARTDIFSLGTMLFQLATGRLPFMADTAGALLKAIAEAKLPDVRTVCPGFPDDLWRILTRMMARDPGDRYPSAEELADDLATVTRDLGLQPAGIEVPRFFVDPPGRTAAIRETAIAARLQRAKALLRERRFPPAIRELDVIRAVVQDHAEAEALYRKAKAAIRRRRWSRTGLWAAAGLFSVVGLAAAAWYLARPPEPGPLPAARDSDAVVVSASAVPSPRPRLDAMPSARRDAQTVSAWAVARKSKPPAGIPAGNSKPPSPVLVPLVIQANPPASRIMVDGKFLGYGTTGTVELAPGRHFVEVSHPKCDVCRDMRYEFVLDPQHPPRAPLRFSIGYLDALLVVQGAEGARVLVNGLPRGQTGRTLRIPMNQPNPVEVQVVVEPPDAPPRASRVVLAPGTTTTVRIP